MGSSRAVKLLHLSIAQFDVGCVEFLGLMVRVESNENGDLLWLLHQPGQRDLVRADLVGRSNRLQGGIDFYAPLFNRRVGSQQNVVRLAIFQYTVLYVTAVG